MIRTVKGNLLEDNAQALVNTVNTVGVMGKGIALQFREAFPNNYLAYRKACKTKEVSIGKMYITTENMLIGSKIIVNFPTKTTWRKPSEYSYIYNGLQALKNEIIIRNIKSIAMPPLGTHNGGLDWLKVKSMIYDILGNLDCDIRLYEPSNAVIEKLKDERVKLTPARAMLLDVMCDRTDYGEFASIFAAEKIVYFLQRFGASDTFRISFKKKYYGPYSGGKITHVLYYLNGSYIKGLGGMQAKPFDELWILNDTKDACLSILKKEDNLKYRGITDTTKDFLKGFYSNFTLELLATIDYLIKDDYRLNDWYNMDINRVEEIINEDLHNWGIRKQNLFVGNRYIKIILNHLKDYNDILYKQ